MKNKKAFTLIEMLGVVALIAIIFLISYTTVLNYFKRSQDKIDEGTFTLLKNATNDYMSDNKDGYPEVNKNVFCIDVNTLISNNYIDEDTVVSKDNKLLAKTMKVSYQDNDYNYELVDSCKEIRDSDRMTAVEYLLANKTNPISVDVYEAGSEEAHNLYTLNHNATAQTDALDDYRYIGSDPHNYVSFNDELWRIIGVFTVEDENGNKERRMKIIRDESIGQRAWDNKSPFDNNWATSTLQLYLNNEYYNQKLVNKKAKQMIDKAKYYTAAIKSRGWGFGAVSNYNYERGDLKEQEDYELSWIGIVGLMYPSDYVYSYVYEVDMPCFNDAYNCSENRTGNPSRSWLYDGQKHISITHMIGSTGYCYGVDSNGSITNLGVWIASQNYVKPVVYLKSDVRIVSGDGTRDKPYRLKI